MADAKRGAASGAATTDTRPRCKIHGELLGIEWDFARQTATVFCPMCVIEGEP